METAVAAQRAAAENIPPGDFNELKAMKSPPPAVRKAFEATLLILTGKAAKGDIWPECKKKWLPNKGKAFKEAIKTLDLSALADGTSPKQLKRLEAYATDPDLTPERVAATSKAAVGLMKFVIAIYQLCSGEGTEVAATDDQVTVHEHAMKVCREHHLLDSEGFIDKACNFTINI